MPLESKFQAELRRDIEALLPGAVVLKNDAALQQGIPDLTVLWYDNWALLEVKRSAKEPYQPNQAWFVARATEMSFGATIYPENKWEVLNAMEQAFRSRR